MVEDMYIAKRRKLLSEYEFLKKKRLNLSARARLRMVALLDHEQNGTPIEETLKEFGYYDKK